MKGELIPLEKARKLALRVCEELAPACKKIAVAGSIRRGVALVGDIDIVALPVQGQERELARLFRGCAGSLIADGAISKRCMLRKSGIQCDLWIAQHRRLELFGGMSGNWGAMLQTYTGSMEHNIKMVARAKEIGKTFRAGWAFVEPEDRF